MTGKFLRAALDVLTAEGHPLTPPQIVGVAVDRRLIQSRGKTPVHTMRARLADDIREKGLNSSFQRVGPNRFGLRDWDLGEYHARPFKRALPNETTVCVAGTIQESLGFGGGIGYSENPESLLDYIKLPSNLHFLDRQTAETTTRYKQLIAYVWLETTDGLVLCYTRGKYSSAHRTLLLGRRSVGFGGHVLREDNESLFASRDAGLEQAALREIGEELGGELPSVIRPVGVIWDDSSLEGQKHIGIVMRGTLPHSRQLSKRASELSINRLQLLTKPELWAAFHSMEFWSQLLIRQFAIDSKPMVVSTIVPSRRPRHIANIALVGEIANGKTLIAAGLSQTRGYDVVSVSSVLRRLLGVKDVREETRWRFQTQALDFINSADGPSLLAGAIVDEMRRRGCTSVIIDGIRQLTTLAVLRGLLPNLIVIYIECPRDLAYQQYRHRLSSASVLQFASVREHPVEADLPRFRYEADAILNNADSIDNTLATLLRWIDG